MIPVELANDHRIVLSKPAFSAASLEAIAVRVSMGEISGSEAIPIGMGCACVKYGQKDCLLYLYGSAACPRSKKEAFSCNEGMPLVRYGLESEKECKGYPFASIQDQNPGRRRLSLVRILVC